jgi:hypothetical protein
MLVQPGGESPDGQGGFLIWWATERARVSSAEILSSWMRFFSRRVRSPELGGEKAGVVLDDQDHTHDLGVVAQKRAEWTGAGFPLRE